MLEKIWPESFTHWNIKSTKRNAVLCEVSKASKELGLVWKFQSPDSEFAYLPAVFPRDDKGQIKMSDEWKAGRSLLTDFGRKPQDPRQDWATHDGVICKRAEVEELYRFKSNFKEGEARDYAELLKQVGRGTEDYDDTIFIQKIEPSLTERLKPFFALAFCLALICFFKYLIFGR